MFRVNNLIHFQVRNELHLIQHCLNYTHIRILRMEMNIQEEKLIQMYVNIQIHIFHNNIITFNIRRNMGYDCMNVFVSRIYAESIKREYTRLKAFHTISISSEEMFQIIKKNVFNI